MPSKQLMTSEYFQYDPRQIGNLKYITAELLKTSLFFVPGALERISMASIAKLVEAPEATVVYVLK